MDHKAPYAITFMYGATGTGESVELRFNWITDRAAPSAVTCEEQGPFEANGFRFTPNAAKVAGTYAKIENNIPIVNDDVKVHINQSTFYSHKAEITLNAETAYYYSVGDGVCQSEPVLIKTRDKNPKAFSFLWIADPQQDKYARNTPFTSWDAIPAKVGGGNFQENLEKAVTHAYAPEQSHLYVNGKPAFVLCTGDHSEHIYDKDGFDGFFRAGHEMLKSTPYSPALGNHDLMGAPNHTGSWDSPDPFASFFKARFNPPPNSAAHTGGEDGGPAAFGDAAKVLDGVNYSFTYGNALVMALQGNPWHTADYALDAQILWMRRTVQQHGHNRWKIVILHHGIYTVSYASVHGYEKLAAAYDECGIDLVLSGHNHVYARSKPIKNFQPVAKGEGTVHITGGTISSNCAWGGYIYKPDRTIPEENGLPIKETMAFISLTDKVDEDNMNVYHVLTVGENGIDITAIRAFDGAVMRHNDTRPSDVPVEYKTPITANKPLPVTIAK